MYVAYMSACLADFVVMCTGGSVWFYACLFISVCVMCTDGSVCRSACPLSVCLPARLSVWLSVCLLGLWSCLVACAPWALDLRDGHNAIGLKPNHAQDYGALK